MRTFSGFLLLSLLCLQVAVAERGVCSRSGSLCILDFDTGKETIITDGFSDMKPSWSKEGNQIVFFRVTKFAVQVADWHTAICIVNIDGTGFRQLTDGLSADYNPTWTRDGSHRIIYSRYNPKRRQSVIHVIDLSGEAAVDQIVSDPSKSEYALSALKDGSILISTNRTIFKGVYYLFTPATAETGAKYELLAYDFRLRGFMDRCTFSPDETKITYEYKGGFNSFDYVGKQIYIADFDVSTRTVTKRLKISKSTEGAMTLYPRWMADGKSVVYHSDREGIQRLYRYDLESRTTKTIDGDRTKKYEFFCGEASPK